MKHSAKAAARLERERAKQERRSAGRRRAGKPGGSAGRPAPADEPGGQDPAAGTAVADPAPGAPGQPGLDRGLRAAAGRVGAVVPGPGVSGTGISGTGISGTGISGTGAGVTVAAGQAGHQRLAQLPYAIVLAGTVAGLVLMQVAKDAVRGGTLVIAGALLAASLTRLVLPEGRAGLLGSRRRLVDVALLTALGAGLLTAGLIVQVPG